MRVITVINAKGGCGKSTIAMNLASALAGSQYRTLLLDMYPQAQVTEWLGLGDGLSIEGSIVSAFLGRSRLSDLVVPTHIPHLSFCPSAQPLEDMGRDLVHSIGYETLLGGFLRDLVSRFDFVVIDSPNQISPIMENSIHAADLFIVPFESTKAVKSYANFLGLVLRIRPEGHFQVLHVLNNFYRPGFRKRVIERMNTESIPIAEVEVRNCGWLAQVDEHGGSIFDYRPKSKGAEDIQALCTYVERILGGREAAVA